MNESENQAKTLQEVERILYEAQSKYKEASLVKDTASRNQTAALNTLNTAQRAFDSVVNSIKRTSERNSDWWNK